MVRIARKQSYQTMFGFQLYKQNDIIREKQVYILLKPFQGANKLRLSKGSVIHKNQSFRFYEGDPILSL